MNAKGVVFARLFSGGCILVLFAGLLGVPGNSLAMPEAKKIYVDANAPGTLQNGQSWPSAYLSLQDALYGAAAGDEIWVARGVYTPTITSGPDATFSLMAGVKIYGGFGGYAVGETSLEQRNWQENVSVLSGDLEGDDVVDANGVVTSSDGIVGANAYHVVTGHTITESAVLDGFTITGGNASGEWPDNQGGGMLNIRGNPTLANLTFSGNAAEEGGGLYSTPINYLSSPAVYVSTEGSDSSEWNCNQMHPCKTIMYAIGRAVALGIHLVRIQAGSYNEVIVMHAGVSLQGGYDAYWNFGPYNDAAYKVEITGGYYAADSQYVSVIARNINQATSLSDVVVRGANGSGTIGGRGRSSYGIVVNNSTSLTIQRVDIVAGNGAGGSGGANGAAAPQTAAPGGLNGEPGHQESIYCNSTNHGAGGAAGVDGAHLSLAGGVGGAGGEMDTSCGVIPNFTATAGDRGENAVTSYPDAGVGGNGGAGASVCGRGNDGLPGKLVNGNGGSAASSVGLVSGFYWQPSAGGAGQVGQDGSGGGGGGGSGGCDEGTDSWGAGGGGGGAGGVAAPSAGTGGFGGGASFGIFITSSTVQVTDVNITRGGGGSGGPGGEGKPGQPGGSGGPGGSPAPNGGPGGRGGNGAAGGASGGGAGGNGGGSYGILRYSSTVNTTNVAYSGGVGGTGGAGGYSPYAPIIGEAGLSGTVEGLYTLSVLLEADFSLQPMQGLLENPPEPETLPNLGPQVDTLAATNLIFSGNSAEYGGGLYAHPEACFTLKNGLFIDNRATDSGGGVYSAGSNCLTLSSITAITNTASVAGGAIFNLGGELTLNNCILWDNAAASGAQLEVDGSGAGIGYCDIQGGSAIGSNIIDADPLFVNLAGRVLGLQVGSPARNTGSNDCACGITFDLVGSPRIMEGTVDMGAFEAWALLYLPMLVR